MYHTYFLPHLNSVSILYLGKLKSRVLCSRNKLAELFLSYLLQNSINFDTRNAFCGTWYLPHSHVHNERTVPIIMAGCIAHPRNVRISTSGLKSDVTIMFLDPNFLYAAIILAIRP